VSSPVGNEADGLAAHLEGWAPEPVAVTEVLDAGPAHALAALLDQPSPVAVAGDPLPPLWHWLHFLEHPPQAALGEDGHPRDGHFLPPLPHRRRMVAGGRWESRGPLLTGAAHTRTTRLERVAVKRGRSGELAFVTIRSEIARDGQLLAVEEQDLVYRSQPPGAGSGPAAARPAGEPLADPPDDGPPASWRLELDPDPRLLFRFSALTANAHRIHYDLPWATDVEGFPGLVVHGPLLVLLMLELPRRRSPEQPVRELGYRLSRPVFAGSPLTVSGDPVADGTASLAAGSGHGACATATAVLGAPTP
jgi:3-methylfumaryl-CoA hydratase